MLDVSVHVPQIRPIIEAAQQADPVTLVQLFGRGLDPDVSSAACTAVADVAGVARLLDDTDQSEPAAQVLLAATHIHLGWAARTGAAAAAVSKSQFKTFTAHLHRAERLLIDVCALDPDNAVAWSHRQLTALGLGLGVGEARRRRDRVAAVAPDLYPSLRTHLQMLCPKWYGSWDLAQEFVAESTARARPGSLTPALLADFHLEQIVEIPQSGRRAHFSPQVVSEVRAAADASVFHPALTGDAYLTQAHTTFAATFCYAGHPVEAARHFEALGDLSSERPWNYFGAAVSEYQYHRAAAERAAR